MERAWFLIQRLPRGAKAQWNHREGICLADVFCARGCDRALPGILHSAPWSYTEGSQKRLESIPALTERMLQAEFSCHSETQGVAKRQESPGLNAVAMSMGVVGLGFVDAVRVQLENSQPCSLPDGSIHTHGHCFSFCVLNT